MGRKKRRAESSRIYCYYCDRDFTTEHELVHHQKEKHLRCPVCHKRMVSMTGLVVHALQVHKRTVSSVPNAIDGRDDPKVDVFGMQGIPQTSNPGSARSSGAMGISTESTADQQASKRHHKNTDFAAASSISSVDQTDVVSQVPDMPPPILVPVPTMHGVAVTQVLPTTAPVPHFHPAYPVMPGLNGAGYSMPQGTDYPSTGYTVPLGQDRNFASRHNPRGTSRYQGRGQFMTHGWGAVGSRPHGRLLKDRPIINPIPHGPIVPYPHPSTPNLSAIPVVPVAMPPAATSHATISTGNNAVGSSVVSAPSATRTVKPVEIVFGEEKVCMEELRAQLPRYRISTTQVPICKPDSEEETKPSTLTVSDEKLSSSFCAAGLDE